MTKTTPTYRSYPNYSTACLYPDRPMDCKKVLKDRWLSPEGMALTDMIIWHLHKKKKLDHLTGLEKIQGKWDLRGFYWPHLRKERQTNYPNKKVPYEYWQLALREIDFSHADLSYLCLVNCTFTDCIFLEADLSDMRLTNCHFSTSTFEKSELTGTTVENRGKHSGSFIQCHFKKAKINKIICNFPLIEDCLFENCLIAQAYFDGSRFQKCRFTGIVGPEVSFSKHSAFAQRSFLKFFRRMYPKDFVNQMSYVDFTEAELDNVHFAAELDLKDCFFNDQHLFYKVHPQETTERYEIRVRTSC